MSTKNATPVVAETTRLIRSTRRRFLGGALRLVAFGAALFGTSTSLLTVTMTPAAAGTNCDGCVGPCFSCDQGNGCCGWTFHDETGGVTVGVCCQCGPTFRRMPFVNTCQACDCICGSLACN